MDFNIWTEMLSGRQTCKLPPDRWGIFHGHNHELRQNPHFKGYAFLGQGRTLIVSSR